jgi:hypothetical protein
VQRRIEVLANKFTEYRGQTVGKIDDRQNTVPHTFQRSVQRQPVWIHPPERNS